MTAKLPYMMSVGLIPKILEKAQNARRPERFTQDFLESKLGHSGGSARAVIPLLKRMKFLGSDGVPTPLYDQFRNSETQGYAIAKGMKNAFNELFDRNEYIYELSREKLSGQIVEITGAAKDDRTTQAIVGTFLALKDLANFEEEIDHDPPENGQYSAERQPQIREKSNDQSAHRDDENVEFRVGYTINLNLPETSDPEVFNAIFRSLKENLLRK